MDALPLSSLERAKRYRELATLARRNADDAKSEETRKSYLTLASQWERLAEQAEHPTDYCKDGLSHLYPQARQQVR